MKESRNWKMMENEIRFSMFRRGGGESGMDAARMGGGVVFRDRTVPVRRFEREVPRRAEPWRHDKN